ncbi:MAG: FAD-dependent thymidylate synthase [Candidatus Ventricola sp.]
MKVSLIRFTPEPDELSGEAAAICTGYEGDPLNAQRGAMNSGHLSVTEHASFTFRVEGVSRVLLAQFTRHRIASFSVQSQRYCGVQPEWIVPQTIVDAGYKHHYLKKCNECYDLLCNMIKDGVPSEDARYVIPQGVVCNLIVTMNARELLHFFELRCCNRAQWEIRRMAGLMLDEVRVVAPELFRDAGPGCVRGACPEGKRSCGKPYTKGENKHDA